MFHASILRLYSWKSVMRERQPPIWEPVEQIVERYLRPDQCHQWPLDPLFPLDVRFLRLNRKYDVPLHRPDHLEIVYLEAGEVGYQVGDRTCLLRKGDTIVVGDSIFHRCLRTGAVSAEVCSTVLSFRSEMISPGSPLGDDLRYLLPFSKQSSAFGNVIPADSGVASDVLTFVDRINQELPASTDRAQLSVRTYLKLILLSVVNYYASCHESRELILRGHDDLARLKPLFDYVTNHASDPIPVEDAARLTAMSPAYFMHFFRRATGTSFVNYLNNFRVMRAQQMLVDTDKNIAEISYQCGFCSQSYLGVVFKRFIGVSPFAYREISKKNADKKSRLD